MIDAYVGIVDQPESMMPLEFDTYKEASDFCDELMRHYKEERAKLFVAIEREDEDV